MSTIETPSLPQIVAASAKQNVLNASRMSASAAEA
jgi:hypothetical protein